MRFVIMYKQITCKDFEQKNKEDGSNHILIKTNCHLRLSNFEQEGVKVLVIAQSVMFLPRVYNMAPQIIHTESYLDLQQKRYASY